MTAKRRITIKTAIGLLAVIALLGTTYQVTYAFASRQAASTGNLFQVGYWTNPLAVIDLKPDTLNLKSVGEPVTCYIELPTGQGVRDIVVTSIMLNNTIQALQSPVDIGDYDSDGMADMMVKFDRVTVNNLLQGRKGYVTLKVSGALRNGNTFEGTDTIKVIDPPSAPKGLQVLDPHTGDQLDIAWQPPSETVELSALADSTSAFLTYRLYRGVLSGGPYLLVTAGSITSFSDTGLTDETLYYYVVTAVDADNQESEYSEEASGQPVGIEGTATPSSTPTNTPGSRVTLEPTQTVTATPETTNTPAEGVTPESTATLEPTATPEPTATIETPVATAEPHMDTPEPPMATPDPPTTTPEPPAATAEPPTDTPEAPTATP